MMTIEFLRGTTLQGRFYHKGQIVAVDSPTAKALIDEGAAMEWKGKAVETIDEPDSEGGEE